MNAYASFQLSNAKRKKKPKEQSLKNGIYSLIFQVLQLSSSVLMMVKNHYDWRNFLPEAAVARIKNVKTHTNIDQCCMSYYWANFIYFSHQWHHSNQSMFYQIIVTTQVDYDRKMPIKSLWKCNFECFSLVNQMVWFKTHDVHQAHSTTVNTKCCPSNVNKYDVIEEWRSMAFLML